MAEQDVVDDRLHLSLEVGHGVDRFIDHARDDRVLDGDRDGDKDVVFRLGLHLQVNLLYAQRDFEFGFGERQFEVQASAASAAELSKALDDGGVAGADREDGTGESDETEQNYDAEQDECCHDSSDRCGIMVLPTDFNLVYDHVFGEAMSNEQARREFAELFKKLRRSIPCWEPTWRPFTCNGSPLDCQVFIVGTNPATPLDFGHYWDWDSGLFNEALFADEYEAHRPLRGTRLRLHRLRNMSNCSGDGGTEAVSFLETNVYPQSGPDPGLLTFRDPVVLRFLIAQVKPKVVIAHGAISIDILRAMYRYRTAQNQKPSFELRIWMTLASNLSSSRFLTSTI